MSLEKCTSIRNTNAGKIADGYWRENYDGLMTVPMMVVCICGSFFYVNDRWIKDSICYNWMYHTNHRGIIRSDVLAAHKKIVLGNQVVSPEQETNQCTRWKLKIGNIAKTRKCMENDMDIYLRRFVVGIIEGEVGNNLRDSHKRYYGINQSGVKTTRNSRGVITHHSTDHVIPEHLCVNDELIFELIVLDDVVELKIIKERILLFSINNLSKHNKYSMFAALAYPWQSVEIISFEQYPYEQRALMDYDFDELFEE